MWTQWLQGSHLGKSGWRQGCCAGPSSHWGGCWPSPAGNRAWLCCPGVRGGGSRSAGHSHYYPTSVQIPDGRAKRAVAPLRLRGDLVSPREARLSVRQGTPTGRILPFSPAWVRPQGGYRGGARNGTYALFRGGSLVLSTGWMPKAPEVQRAACWILCTQTRFRATARISRWRLELSRSGLKLYSVPSHCPFYPLQFPEATISELLTLRGGEGCLS